MNTPILFLIFNRPDTTQKVFDAIRKAQPKQLFVAADGARIDRGGDKEKCEITRNIIKQVDWDCEVKTLFRNENLGCGKAVSGAITWFFENVEEGIILEDDCLPNSDFFIYCKEMLDYYRNNRDVMFIGGDNFQKGKKWGDASYYFSAYNHVWGWATWKRTWDIYDFKLNNINWDEINDILNFYFNSTPQINYWKNIFKRMKGDNPIDTWDYQLTLSIWKNKGISIIPNVNLVSNIGFGVQATHTNNKNASSNMLVNDILPIVYSKIILVYKDADFRYYRLFLKRWTIKKVLNKVLKFINFNTIYGE